MSHASVPANPTSHNVASLLPKLQDADSDIRYMTLNDLHTMLNIGAPTFLSHDYTTCCKVVDGLLHTLADTHGDVQNMAIRCLGPFVNKAPETILCPTIEKVSNIRTEGSLDNSIPALAVRAIVVALPHPTPGVQRTQKMLESYAAVSKALIPRLVGKVVVPLREGKLPAPPKGMLQEDLESGNDSNSLDLLAEVARCFGPLLQEAEVQALEEVTMNILESDKCGTVMKKKAVAALAALAAYFSDALLALHVTNTIEKLRSPHLTSQQRRLYITGYGSLARSIPQKFGPYLKTLAPFVLAPLSESELQDQQEAEIEADGERDVQLEEVREAALIAIEGFLESCAKDMKLYQQDVLDSATRFLNYEPNVAGDEDEDMDEDLEDDEFAVDEDFEEETGFEDEDDVSWKVRRCSAKTLHALIQTLDANDPAMFSTIAPALIARFKEKEESVRTEVIATLAFLVTKVGATTSDSAVEEAQEPIPQSRKRRRGFSESVGSDFHGMETSMNGYASPATPPPADPAALGLAKISPEVVKGAAKLLKTSTVPTKQGVLALLRDMVAAQRGGLTKQADFVVDPVIETLTSTNTTASNLASNNLRIEALALLRAIAETHSNKVLSPHLAKIIPALVTAAKDRFAKVSSAAFGTIECFVKALTPPRASTSKKDNAAFLSELYAVIVERISASDTDTEVRQKAVQALGLLVGRTAGPAGEGLLSQDDRYAAQQLISERLRNELTRLPCVRAVDVIACHSQSKQDFKPGFVGVVALELGAQLRKASRSLRGASLSALKMLAVNQSSRGWMDDSVVSQLIVMLIPLLKTDDLHMLGPALIVLAAFAKERANLVATPEVVEGICGIVTGSVSGAALDSLIACVETIGQAGAGKSLMQALLDVGIQGDTDITGQVIGTLLVSGGGGVGVTLDAFIKELQTQSDDAKRCLALSVLGEAGLRMGSSSPLKPESFMAYFGDASAKVQLAAAVALGRAGAGDVKQYLPKILDALTQGKQYLLLHSVKELLQHSTAEDDIKPYTANLWNNIISSGQAEDNKVVGAECLGRLAIIDPGAYLPQLQAFLLNNSPAIRGMVISALRYVFSDTEPSYNPSLKSFILPMLETMLVDEDLDNKRLALSTFNSAVHNKPDLVLPALLNLVPHAIQATVPRPELIREVSMGPFKHKVDDGLEIRKSAYETLYALLESPASRQRIDMVAYYERIVEGIADEHEIKILCCLVLSKLLVIAPVESVRQSDKLATHFRAVLAVKPKDSAVKQELEKMTEVNKAIIKVSLAFNKVLTAGEGGASDEGNKAWKDYFEWVKKEFPVFVRESQDDDSRDR